MSFAKLIAVLLVLAALGAGGWLAVGWFGPPSGQQIAAYDTQVAAHRVGGRLRVRGSASPEGAVAERSARLAEHAQALTQLDMRLAQWDSTHPDHHFRAHYAALRRETQLFRDYFAAWHTIDQAHIKPVVVCDCGWRTQCYTPTEYARLQGLQAAWLRQYAENDAAFLAVAKTAAPNVGIDTTPTFSRPNEYAC